jgi:TPR repeat protein
MENMNLSEGIAAAERGEFKRAFDLLIELARNGNQVAQSHIATMYQCGNGVVADGNAAIEWYSKAAAQTLADKKLAGLAHHNLHVLYQCGAAGVAPNAELAAQHLQKAKDLGADMYQA